MKKVFEVRIDFCETVWKSCYAYVEAETKDEAEDLFNDDPWKYDWEGWEEHDSEMGDWIIDSIEYDDFMTKRLHEKEVNPLLEKITERMKAEDLND